MNRTLLTVTLALTTIWSSSCYKVWTCTCNTTANDPSGQFVPYMDNSVTTAPNFKKDAKRQCDETAARFTDSLQTTGCTLK